MKIFASIYDATLSNPLSPKPLCVLGVLDTEKGLEIANAMLTWLSPPYDVRVVFHDGTQFELPALKEAQRISMETGQPVLYLHTRGAVNTWRTTAPTHKMWCEEFGVQWRKYQQLVDDPRPTIACPFADANGEHRYNGFIANAAAWAMADLQPSDDRMVYEHIWRGKDVRLIGTLIQSDVNDVKKIRQYLYRNYE